MTLADLTLARGGPTLATLVRPRSEALFAKRSGLRLRGKAKRPGLATLIGHVGRLASLAVLVPICTRVHVSRFGPKVPHFSRKDPPVGGAAPGWTWLVMSKNEGRQKIYRSPQSGAVSGIHALDMAE